MSERKKLLIMLLAYVNTGFQSFFETTTLAATMRAKSASSALHISAFNCANNNMQSNMQ